MKIKRYIKYIFSLLLALCLVLQPICDADALSPSIAVTDAYKESVYYQRLCEVELSGNYHQDIVNVALSQIGYHEGMSKDDYGGGNTAGYMNFIEYGQVFWGADREWCAMFVSWCARQAKLPYNAVNTALRARNDGAGGETEHCFHMWFAEDQYRTPQYGDIIFFRNSRGDPWVHTGIVVQVSDTHVVTVEGNKLNGVRICKYERDAQCIMGYGFYYSVSPVWADPEIPNICSMNLVSNSPNRGKIPDEDANYDFTTLYAAEGYSFDIPPQAFLQDDSVLLGYHARRDDTKEWYCGEELGWRSEGEMLSRDLKPVMLPDGKAWDFDGQWAGLESVTLYTVWRDQYGLESADGSFDEACVSAGVKEEAMRDKVRKIWERWDIISRLDIEPAR